MSAYFPSDIAWDRLNSTLEVCSEMKLNECVRAYFVQLERSSSFILIKGIKHALAPSFELHIRANFYTTSGGYEEYVYRVSPLWEQK